MTYHVYIMASASHALYTGVTNDIERRVVEHREAKLPSFSARYKTRNLVYTENFGEIRAAIAREKQIKGWLRIKKLALINSVSPQWKDLSADWPNSKGLIMAPAHGAIRAPTHDVIPAAGKGVVPVVGKRSLCRTARAQHNRVS